MKIANNGGTADYIAGLIGKIEPEIGQFHSRFNNTQGNFTTKIAIRMKIPSHGGYACTGETEIFPVIYTGSQNVNGGAIKDTSLPFHVTKRGRELWLAYVDGLAEKLLEYINEQ